MRKIQILFPNPILERLKEISREEDVPVSELVRRATEDWLEKVNYMRGETRRRPITIPVFSGGEILVTAREMKEICYDPDESSGQ